MRVIPIAAAAVVLALAGCEFITDTTARAREKLSERAAHRTRSFAAAPRVVYEAARIAVGQMGYRFVRGGAAQGELEAMSGVHSGDHPGSARQLMLKAKLESEPGGGTRISVWITEMVESDSSGRMGVATQSPLRDTPQHEVFFRRVQSALQAD